jgi:RimJ/RimL family protein N-acetyltransferase
VKPWHYSALMFPREVLTERLRLRQWRPEDAEPLFRIYLDRQYLEHMTPMDLDETAEQVERLSRTWDEEGFGLWAAEDRRTGAFLGRIGLIRHHDWPLEPGPVEVGWVLAPEARGRGLATEGGRAAIDAAFAHLDVDRVISIARPGNWPSRRVMERLGLTLRGEADWRGSHMVWYAVDREDWQG